MSNAKGKCFKILVGALEFPLCLIQHRIGACELFRFLGQITMCTLQLGQRLLGTGISGQCLVHQLSLAINVDERPGSQKRLDYSIAQDQESGSEYGVSE